MAEFRYRAKKGPTEVVEGVVEAHSEKEVVEKLNELGYVPVRVEMATAVKTEVRHERVHVSGGRVRSGDITLFSRQLASLLRSGIPILSAIGIISEQSTSPVLTRILGEIHDVVKDGGTFSGSLAKYPRIFPSLYIAMIRTGEDSGQLPEALLRLAEYRMRQEEMYSRFRLALAYPFLMALVGLGTIIFMLTFVMPRLMQIFSTIGQDLPLPTRVLMTLSTTLRERWPWIVGLGALIAFVFRQQSRTKAGRAFASVVSLHMPMIGKFILKAELARFTHTLALLIKSGVPILKAIEIAIPVLDNEILKAEFHKSYKTLEGGGSFGKSLKGARLFPLFMTNLIIVGEESGKLDEALAEIASSYERDTEETMRMMSSLLEPLMILVMGLIVGSIVVAMLLPIFEMNLMSR